MADFIEEGGLWHAKEMAYKSEISEEGKASSLKAAFGIEFTELVRHPVLKYTDDASTHFLDKEGRHYWFCWSRNNVGNRWNRV